MFEPSLNLFWACLRFGPVFATQPLAPHHEELRFKTKVYLSLA